MNEKLSNNIDGNYNLDYKSNSNTKGDLVSITNDVIQRSINHNNNGQNTDAEEMDLALIKKENTDLVMVNEEYFDKIRLLLNDTIKDLNGELSVVNSELEQLELKYNEFMVSGYKEGLISENDYYYNPDSLKDSSYQLEIYLSQHGYDLNNSVEYLKGKTEYEKWVDEVYTPLFDKYFSDSMGMSFEEYKIKISELQTNISELKGYVSYLSAYDYNLRQQEKLLPYLEMMETDEYKEYLKSAEVPTMSSIQNDYFGRVVQENMSTYQYLMSISEYLSEDDYYMLKYLGGTKGKEAILGYLNAIEDRLNQAKGREEADKYIASVTDENGEINLNPSNFLSTIGKGLGDGVETFEEGISNLLDFSGDGIKSDNQYAQMYILQTLQETGELDDGFLGETYQISTSIGNMMPTVAISSVVSVLGTPALGSTVGQTLMGISVAGNSKNDALISGSNTINAYIYGIFSGASEALIGKLLGNIPGLNENAKFAFKEILSEGTEELVQEYVDAGFRAMVLGETVDLTELNGNALKSFYYGCITSGIMTGGQTAINVTIGGVKYTYDNLNTFMNSYKGGNISENLESTKVYKLSDRRWSNKYFKDLAKEYDDLSFISQETGKYLEEIFFDSDNVIGIHRCGMMEATRIIDDGLLLTGHISSGVQTSNIDLERNISFYNKTEMGFLNFIRDLKSGGSYKTINGTGDVIVVSIPKNELVSSNPDNISFKNPSSAINFSGVTPKLDSKYLLGYLESSPETLSDIKFNDLYANNQSTVESTEKISTDVKSDSGNLSQTNTENNGNKLPDDIKVRMMLENCTIYNPNDIVLLYNYFKSTYTDEILANSHDPVLLEEFQSYLDMLENIIENSDNLDDDTLQFYMDFYNQVLDIKRNYFNKNLSNMKFGDQVDIGSDEFIEQAVIANLSIQKGEDYVLEIESLEELPSDFYLYIENIYKFSVLIDGKYQLTGIDLIQKIAFDNNCTVDDIYKSFNSYKNTKELVMQMIESLKSKYNKRTVLTVISDLISYVEAPFFWSDSCWSVSKDILNEYNFKNVFLGCSSEEIKKACFAVILENQAIKRIKYVNLTNFESSFEQMYEWYESVRPTNLETYGVAQGCIAGLCNYKLNRRRYSYTQIKEKISKMIEAGKVLPKIIAIPTNEYLYLKNKLEKSGFTSDDAEVILESINDAGACSYASVCNEIFYKFRNDPQLFEEIFGYSYYKNGDKSKGLNDSELLLDLYLFANDVKNGGNLISNNCLIELGSTIDYMGRNILNSEEQNFMSDGYHGRNVVTIERFLQSKDGNLSYSSEAIRNMYKTIYSDEEFDDIISRLSIAVAEGKQVTLDYFYKKEAGDKVIRMKSLNLFKYSSTSTAEWGEGGGHSVAVTGVHPKGLIISSWGEKYLIPFKDLKNGGKFNFYISDIVIDDFNI